MVELKHKTVLVVDDHDSIRFAICDHLRPMCAVASARNGVEALELLRARQIDLVITDIRMPRMDGLELIRAVGREFPGTHYALMTAYDPDDYLRFVREEQIWNIIPKTTLLDLHFVSIMAYKLLSGDIFGIDKYFPEAPVTETTLGVLQRINESEAPLSDGLYTFGISTPSDYDRLSETVGRFLMRHGTPSMILQVVEELTSNALVRSPRHLVEQLGPKAGARDLLKAVVAEGTESPYLVTCGILERTAVLSVVDPHGTLERADVLERLERNTSVGPDGLPLGVHDPHGRGLYISREHLDHLIFNVAPGKRTEVIGLLSLDQDQRYRAVSIYQADVPKPTRVTSDNS